jgi:putative photosynthetic complex assembly protein
MQMTNVTTANDEAIPTINTNRPVGLGLPMLAIAFTLIVIVVMVFSKPAHEVTVSGANDRLQALALRDIRFEDQADGSIRVIDAKLREQIALVAPASNGFLRGAVRGLVRERKLQRLGTEVPFTLAALADGRLVLHDGATGHEIDLASFGSTNAAVFSKLLVPEVKP